MVNLLLCVSANLFPLWQCISNFTIGIDIKILLLIYIFSEANFLYCQVSDFHVDFRLQDVFGIAFFNLLAELFSQFINKMKNMIQKQISMYYNI